MKELEYKPFISTLKPAEVLFLTDSGKAREQEYIKHILADLILKKVLEIQIVTRKPHPRDPAEYTYVEIGRGINYYFYKPSEYEAVFTSQISEDKVMYLHNYIKVMSKEIPLLGKLKKQIINNAGLKKFYKRNPINGLSGKFKLNREGQILKGTINQVLNDARTEIPKLISQPNELFEQVEYLGGNIFFVKNVDQHVWNSICSTVSKRAKNQKIHLNNHNLQFLDESYYSPEIFRKISIFFFNMDKFIHDDGSFRNEAFEMDWSWALEF